MSEHITNAKRAEYADRTLLVYKQYTGLDSAREVDETAFQELLVDLRHWCDTQGLDFDQCVLESEGTYNEEIEDDKYRR